MPTGSKIKEIRMQRGLTQKQLGERCGMYESQIRKYENGNANPKIETLQKIADVLGCATTDLMEIPFGPFTNSENYTPHPNANNILSDIYTADLLDAFNRLNLSGKERAVSQVQLVASVPEFQKKKKRKSDLYDN
nr:MAG TPA: Repressor protein CI [Caudoviricetes sp.]